MDQLENCIHVTDQRQCTFTAYILYFHNLSFTFYFTYISVKKNLLIKIPSKRSFVFTKEDNNLASFLADMFVKMEGLLFR